MQVAKMNSAPRMMNSAPRILVADDDREILDAYTSVLCPAAESAEAPAGMADLEAELFGSVETHQDGPQYDVTLARQGDEAVEKARAAKEAGDPFAVAFLDVRMPPGIDGVETAVRIHALDPDINIIFVTGYSDLPPREIAARISSADKMLYCQKPLQASEIEQFACALTAKWAAERALVAAKEGAEAANLAKSKFLAGMSHELRTPLNAIIGFAELIERQSASSPSGAQYAEYAQLITDSGQQLLYLDNGVLDLAKVEAGNFELQESGVDVQHLIDKVFDLIRPRLEDSGQTYTVEVPPNLPKLFADERALIQVLLNLLGNAIKFSPEGGEIKIGAGCDDARKLWVSISDNGIGMAATDIATALAPFEQIDGDLNRKFSGTGLGLPLAVALVERHSGKLVMESEPNLGTMVTMTFPANRSMSERPPAG